MNAPHDDLVQAYLDGQLDEAACADFERRLHSEPELAEQLIRVARDEAIMTEWAHANRSVETTVQPSRRPLSRRLVFGVAASVLAACLLLAVLTGLFNPQPPTAVASFAELEDVAGEVYIVGESGESTAARTGSRLTHGQGLRTGEAGSVVMVSDATRLELGADTSIRLSAIEGDTKKVILEQGSVAADVTRQTLSPMLLATQQGEAYLESKSSFMSMPEGTRIEAEARPVRFRKHDGQSVSVPPGWYAVALPANANPMVPRPMPRQSKPRFEIEEESGPVLAVALSPDGTLLAIGCPDGSIKVCNAADGSPLRILKAHRQMVRCLAFSPDGKLLASGSQDRKVELFDPHTGNELGKLAGYKGAIESLAFSPDGSLLLTGGTQPREQAEVRLWNVTTRQEIASLEHQRTGVTAVAFSPNGKQLAIAGRDHLIWLLELGSFAIQATLAGHQAPVHAIAYSPDGNSLVSGSRDRTVRVWDVSTGAQRTLFPAQGNPVRALAFSSDGQILAAADVNVRLYDWATGQERLILKGHKKQITAMVFSADGKLLATASQDKTVRLWEVPAAEPAPKPTRALPDAG